MKKTSRSLGIALLAAGIVVVLGVVLLLMSDKSVEDSLLDTVEESTTTTPAVSDFRTETLGTSVEGRLIQAFIYGRGDTHLLFVGGIHGGYEWNSTLLAYQLIDYLEANPGTLPAGLSVSIVPTANPDGLYGVVGTSGRFTPADVSVDDTVLTAGRFNANDVDLNRNFACNWASESSWRGQTVSAGTSAFSEPEAQAIRNYVLNSLPDAAVFFHSAAGAVYGAACDGVLGPGTKRLLDTYARASGYRAVDLFTAYPITGDVESWLTSIGIPAVSVELTNHTDVELQKNLAGIKALFDHYNQK
jgi:predicted deacylase